MKDYGLTIICDRDVEDILISVISIRIYNSCDGKWYFDRYRNKDLKGIVFYGNISNVIDQINECIIECKHITGSKIETTLLENTKYDLSNIIAGPDARKTFNGFNLLSNKSVLLWARCAKNRGSTRSIFVNVMLNYANDIEPSRKYGDPPALMLSLASHAEAFIAGTINPTDTRKKFDERYIYFRNNIINTIHSVDENNECVDEILGEKWRETISKTMHSVKKGVNAGTIFPGLSNIVISTDKNLLSSPMHRKLLSSRIYQKKMERSPSAKANRITLGFVYLSLFRSGLYMVDRFLMCYCLARALEDAYGISTKAALDKAIRRARTEYLKPW